MPARKPPPKSDHVTRYVPPSGQHRDPDTDEFIQLAPSAISLRERDKGGLSTIWIEHFGSKAWATKRSAALMFRHSATRNNRLPARGLFATANVKSILDAGVQYGNPLRVIHDPSRTNKAHALVRQFSDEDIELLGFLRDEVFAELDFVGDLNL